MGVCGGGGVRSGVGDGVTHLCSFGGVRLSTGQYVSEGFIGVVRLSMRMYLPRVVVWQFRKPNVRHLASVLSKSEVFDPVKEDEHGGVCPRVNA